MAESAHMQGRGSLQGAFITFEGIDGCGKTTQAQLLARRLDRAGISLLETREPGGTAVGRELRELLLNPEYGALTPDAELLLFLADRVQHLAELIVPALERGQTVICDRFHDSTVAFQQHGRELDFSAVESVVNRLIVPHTPHLTLWLDVDPGVARERIRQRLEADNGAGQAVTRLENEAENFHLRVRRGYEKLYQSFPLRIVKIDAGGSIEDIAEAVWNVVTDRYDVL